MVKKDQILCETTKLIAELGFDGTSMQLIAEAVGLQKQSLYAHFKSKDEIYSEVIRKQNEYITIKLDECIRLNSDRTTEELLMEVFRCYVTMFSRNEILKVYKRLQLERNKAAGEDAIEERLKHRIFDIVSQRHEHLSNPENYARFFEYYMLTIQGYLDTMLTGKHDEEVWLGVWEHCRTGLRMAL